MNTKRLIETLAITAVGAGVILALTDTARHDASRDADAAGAASEAAAAPLAAFTAPVEQEGDHIKPAELAERMLSGGASVVTVDVRPAEEFAAYHLPGAVNLTVPQVHGAEGAALLAAHADQLVVLYSNGMVHPAQAWVELARRGHGNVRVLEGGLTAFKQEILTPPSLRGPISQARARAAAPQFARAKAFVLGPEDGRTAVAAEGPAAGPPG
jgi:rhodanese-related sulfurtransferase